jgi:hypothetical protein
MLDLIVGTPYFVCHRQRDGTAALISAPLLPEWLDDPAAAGVLATAAGHFIASLLNTQATHATPSASS